MSYKEEFQQIGNNEFSYYGFMIEKEVSSIQRRNSFELHAVYKKRSTQEEFLKSGNNKTEKKFSVYNSIEEDAFKEMKILIDNYLDGLD